MTPLEENQYSIKSNKDFMNKTKKNEKVPNGYQIVSFDVKSLFTNIPLDQITPFVFLKKLKNMRFP